MGKRRELVMVDTREMIEDMRTLLRKFLRFLLWLLGFATYPVIYFMSRRRKKCIPPITNSILLLSAKKLAHKIRNKEIRSEDVIKAYIQRCKEVNPIINAIVETRYEEALCEAKNVDLMIDSDHHTVEDLEKFYPLLGVPITVKESIAVAGMSNEAGRFRENRVPATIDADCVSLVKAAGGIPLLVSNTPELCMCWETYNYVTGLTKNPYNTRRTSGGSSGGEAALISSGASVIGLGSDIAGSLRLPAMYTGIFGHKPSPYSVSTVGHMPSCESEDWNKYFILGPMTRYAEDLPLILKVINNQKALKLDLDKDVSIRNMRFYYMEGENSGATNKINSDMLMAFEKVKMHFKNKYNITLAKAEFKNMKYAFEISVLNMLRLDGVDTIFSKPGNPSKWNSVTVQLIKKIFGCSKSIMTCVLYGVLKKFTNILGKENYEKAEHITSKLRQEFVDLLQDNSVCFYPTFTKTATYHYDFFRHMMDYAYLFIFNGLGLPVTNCPVGFTTKGMPVGVQVVASPGCDHLLFAVAKEFEEAFGGWTPPSMLNNDRRLI